MIVQIDRVGFNRALLKSSSWLVGMLVLRLGHSFSSIFPNYNDLNKNKLISYSRNNRLNSSTLKYRMDLATTINKDNTDELGLYKQAWKYFAEEGNEQNKTKAIELFELLTEHSYSKASQNSKIAFYNSGFTDNIAASIELMEESTKKELAQYQNALAGLYLLGDGVQKNINNAIYLLEQAAQNNLVDAQYSLGKFYLDRSNETNVANGSNWIEKWVHASLARTQFNLEETYLLENKIKITKEKAIYWIKKAADQQYAAAQYLLGKMNAEGNGVQKSDINAVFWYEKAANQAYSKAQFELGKHCFFGKGIEKNVTRTIEWTQKAAENGLADAQYSLGKMYYQGLLVEKNKIKALNWIQKAANQGLLNAKNLLGKIYIDGDLVEVNKIKAFKLFEESANGGLVEAKVNLGYLYLKGDGVSQNVLKAINLFKQAAKEEDVDAKNILAKLDLVYKYVISITIISLITGLAYRFKLFFGLNMIINNKKDNSPLQNNVCENNDKRKQVNVMPYNEKRLNLFKSYVKEKCLECNINEEDVNSFIEKLPTPSIPFKCFFKKVSEDKLNVVGVKPIENIFKSNLRIHLKVITEYWEVPKKNKRDTFEINRDVLELCKPFEQLFATNFKWIKVTDSLIIERTSQMTIVNKATYLRLFQEKDKRLKQILNEQENLINEIVSIIQYAENIQTSSEFENQRDNYFMKQKEFQKLSNEINQIYEFNHCHMLKIREFYDSTIFVRDQNTNKKVNVKELLTYSMFKKDRQLELQIKPKNTYLEPYNVKKTKSSKEPLPLTNQVEPCEKEQKRLTENNLNNMVEIFCKEYKKWISFQVEMLKLNKKSLDSFPGKEYSELAQYIKIELTVEDVLKQVDIILIDLTKNNDFSFYEHNLFLNKIKSNLQGKYAQHISRYLNEKVMAYNFVQSEKGEFVNVVGMFKLEGKKPLHMWMEKQLYNRLRGVFGFKHISTFPIRLDCLPRKIEQNLYHAKICGDGEKAGNCGRLFYAIINRTFLITTYDPYHKEDYKSYQINQNQQVMEFLSLK